MLSAVLLAHQGGWDETLMVAGPIALIWLVLSRANRRAKRQLIADTTPVADETPTDGPTSGVGSAD